MKITHTPSDVGRGQMVITFDDQEERAEIYRRHLREQQEFDPNRPDVLHEVEREEALNTFVYETWLTIDPDWPEMHLPETVVYTGQGSADLVEIRDGVRSTCDEPAYLTETISTHPNWRALAWWPLYAIMVAVAVVTTIVMLDHAAVGAAVGALVAYILSTIASSPIKVVSTVDEDEILQLVADRPEPTADGVPHVVRVIQETTGNIIELLAVRTPEMQSPQRLLTSGGDAPATSLFEFPAQTPAISLGIWEVEPDASVEDVAEALHEIKGLAVELERRSSSVRSEAHLMLEQGETEHQLVKSDLKLQHDLMQHVLRSH